MSQSNPKLGAAATPSTEEQSGTVWKIIKEIEAEEFQQRLFEHCETNPDLRNDLERVFFTKGKNIVRYYPGDTEPSYASGTVLNETESDQEDDLSTSPIAIGDEQVVYRFEECLNCKKDFDLVKNKARACEWHPGKIRGSSVLRGEDVKCWACCNTPRPLGCKGCKRTRHKSANNIIQKRKPESSGSKKRKAED